MGQGEGGGDMGRRAAVFIVALTLGAFLAPLPAAAQAPGKVYRIGSLIQSNPSVAAPYLEAFKQGLREFGYVEGQNVVIERRWADNNVDKLPDLAAELVRLKLDVIVTVTVPVAEAAKKGTSPIDLAGKRLKLLGWSRADGTRPSRPWPGIRWAR